MLGRLVGGGQEAARREVGWPGASRDTAVPPPPPLKIIIFVCTICHALPCSRYSYLPHTFACATIFSLPHITLHTIESSRTLSPFIYLSAQGFDKKYFCAQSRFRTAKPAAVRSATLNKFMVRHAASSSRSLSDMA